MTEKDATGQSDLGRTIETAKQQLEHMIDVHPEGMVLTGPELTVVRINNQALVLLGGSAYSDVLGRKLPDLVSDLAGEADKAAIADFFAGRSTPTGGNGQLSIRVDTADGTSRVLGMTLVQAGTDDQSVLIVTDQDTRIAENARAERRHKLEAAELIGGALMHNVNQPLTVVLIEAHLMLVQVEQGEVDREALTTALKKILHHTEKISEMIKKASNITDFVTSDYVGETSILDLNRSSTRNAANPDGRT